MKLGTFTLYARAKLLFCQSKPIAFLPFSLPSSLLKLPNVNYQYIPVDSFDPLFINKISTDCLFCFVLDVTLRKKDKLQIAETMKKENKKPEPSKDVHLQALKIFINLFPKGTV